PAAAVNPSGTKTGAGVTVSSPRVVVTTPDVNQGSQVDQTPPQQSPATNEGNSANAQPAPFSTTASTNSPTPSDPGPAPGGNITVQVAAVTKQEEADVLVAALRKKNYPGFLAPRNRVDNLYHVQVGPCAKMKDAEAIKSKLAGDGYNAIVKKKTDKNLETLLKVH